MQQRPGQNEGESSKQYAKRMLTRAIVSLELEPGQKIVEAQLCAQLGMSRTPIREAVLELSQNRLIDVFPKYGTYVARIDTQLVEEVRSLRCVLETELAGQACVCFSQQETDRLRENIAVWRYYMERRSEAKTLELDKAFHDLLYDLCGRPYWKELVHTVAPHFDRTMVLGLRCKPPTAILDDHERLVDAIERKDAAAACAIARQHMQRYTENRPLMEQRYPDYFKKPEARGPA